MKEEKKEREGINPSTLTSTQLNALRVYAQEHGRRWKSELNKAWMTGVYDSQDHSAVLQSIRNQFGPSWLTRFRFPLESTSSVKTPASPTEIGGKSHSRQEDCTVDPETLCCIACGVDHSEECLDCGKRGYHASTCPQF